MGYRKFLILVFITIFSNSCQENSSSNSQGTEKKPNPTSQTIEWRCFSLKNDKNAIYTKLLFDDTNGVSGIVQGVTHDKPNKIYTSYESVVVGRFENGNLKVKVTTAIGDDIQESNEDWVLIHEELTTKQGSLKTIACKTINLKTFNKKLTIPEQFANAQSDWNVFWAHFQSAVKNQNIKTIIKLSAFPLVGTEHLNNGKPLDAHTYFDRPSILVDKVTRNRIANTATEELEQMEISTEEEAARLQVPKGTVVKTLSVVEVFDQGTDSQTESATIYYFAKKKGRYRLIGLAIAG